MYLVTVQSKQRYILILPAFGIISHTVETFSRKSIFGQNGPKNIFYFLQQTICRKVLVCKVGDTGYVSHFWSADPVKIFLTESNNPQVTNAPALVVPKSAPTWARLSTLVGTSEAIRLLLVTLLFGTHFLLFWDVSFLLSVFALGLGVPLTRVEDAARFNQWLGGLIDGNGCFLLSKKGYASLEIVVELRDKRCLYEIKQAFGGAVQLRAGDNRLRYRLHNRPGLLKLIAAVNGQIRSPVRLAQLHKVCDKYAIPLIFPAPLKYRDGWWSGFFDADGSVDLRLVASQVEISASQKNKLLLDMLQALYGGQIRALKSAAAFKWHVFRKEEIIRLADDYFKNYPSRTPKNNRLRLLPYYFRLREQKAHLAAPSSVQGKLWVKFLKDWSRWGV